jgi:hypothetical protein
MNNINRNVLESISSTRVLAEASARISTMFGQCINAMEEDLAAIKHIVEESMASNSKFAADHTTAVAALSAQAVSFNDARFKQGQAAFHKVKDVGGLVDELKLVLQTVMTVLDTSVPLTLQSVLAQTIPPSLQTVLGDTISLTLHDILNDTFSKFTSKYQSMGDDMTQQVKDVLETHNASLIAEYTTVKLSIQDVLARLSRLERSEDDGNPPCGGSNSGGARVSGWNNPGRSGHGGEWAPHLTGRQVHIDMDKEVPHPLVVNDGTPNLNRESNPGKPSLPSPRRSPSWGRAWVEEEERKAAARWHGYGDTQLHVDTSDWKIQGGKIVFPRLVNHACYARKKNESHFDLAGLAHADYHVDKDGVEVLTKHIISNFGYKSIHAYHPDDVLLCFNEIILLHKVVVQGWRNPWTQFCGGPIVEYILKKALPVFPCLCSLDVADAVKFYDGLQKISMRYLLPLMPFDSICLDFGFEGLCPPGLGTVKYATIVSAWMDVLPWILPQLNADMELVTFSVGFDSNNGFDLLWRVLELAVPGLKSTNPVQVLIWSPTSDILSFCREHLLYFRLQSKHNMFFNARTQTNIFMHNIQHLEYADVVTTL